MQIAEKPLLKIEAIAENGIKLYPKGPLAIVATPIVDRINRIFADEKPIRSGPDKFIFSTWTPPAPSLAFDRMISAQVASIIGRRIPDQLSIAVMRACPNRCIHCSAPSRQGEILSRSEIERAIDEALRLGSYMVTFDGGEPMLRDDLCQMAAHVDSRAIAAAFTSGYRLTEDLAVRLKQCGLYAVRVSIDSPCPSDHDMVRGRKGAFSDALLGIRNALAAGLLVDMFMVVSPYNIDQLEEAFELADELGVHELSLYEIVAVGRWATHVDEVLSPLDIKKLENFHKEKNKGKGPRVTAFPYQLGREMFGCFAGRRWIHIDASGNALPCAYMPLAFGNIKERSLGDLWRDISRYDWFKRRCSCQMKDAAFRHAHPHLFSGPYLDLDPELQQTDQSYR